MTTGACPKCGNGVDFEPVEMLPKIVPLCDECEAVQSATWATDREEVRWQNLFNARIPAGYRDCSSDMVKPCYMPALSWTAASNHGGIGLIGPSGHGKSSAISCLLWSTRLPFRWWIGTEARDAAIEAATADKDREGATRRWEAAMGAPILVLDDVSQGKMTEAWSSKLFDLLETRLGSALPTLWTSQISVTEIEQKIIRQNGFDTAQAEAITRRLAQHSLVLKP